MNNFYYTLYNSAYLITTLVIMLFKSTYNIKLIPLIFLLFTIEPISLIINAQISWSSKIDSVSTLSSPRAADLNDDGVKDLVVGAGTDSTFSNYGVVALDGNTGQLLWNLSTPDEIFTSAVFNDINNDIYDDIEIISTSWLIDIDPDESGRKLIEEITNFLNR